mmetsp:Transcript_44151/g.127459  ORF Transcript_44151/g.127459 Transcript_44151/m.127459 type:complete len:227 (-) Transcript_44151:333-1013(-)
MDRRQLASPAEPAALRPFSAHAATPSPPSPPQTRPGRSTSPATPTSAASSVRRHPHRRLSPPKGWRVVARGSSRTLVRTPSPFSSSSLTASCASPLSVAGSSHRRCRQHRPGRAHALSSGSAPWGRAADRGPCAPPVAKRQRVRAGRRRTTHCLSPDSYRAKLCRPPLHHPSRGRRGRCTRLYARRQLPPRPRTTNSPPVWCARPCRASASSASGHAWAAPKRHPG